jgi:hypothetical protein
MRSLKLTPLKASEEGTEMDTQMRSYPIIRVVRRRNSAVRYRGAILLLLCVMPCAVRGQTTSPSSQSSSASALPERELANVLTDALNPHRPQDRMLLMRDDVQRELSLNPRQQEQITALSAQTEQTLNAVPFKITAQLRQATANQDGSHALSQSYNFAIEPDGQVTVTGKGVDAQTLSDVAAKVQEGRAQVQQEDLKQRDSILTPAQRTRLKELDMQWRGPFLLLSKIGVEDMKLSDEQWKKFQNVWEKLQTRVARNEKDLAPKAAVFIRDFGGAAVQQEGFRALMRQLWRDDRKSRGQAEKQVLDVLTSAQKQQWAAWTGKPFTFRDYDSTDRPSLPR